jgi:tryptophan synthase alpha chain
LNRIDKRFAALAEQGRAAFVAYVMGGDPDYETSLDILRGLPGAGVDVIELGYAFSDPMAEGPPIQRAALRALKAGMTLNRTLSLAAEFRKTDRETPVVLMGYLNPLFSAGYVAFASRAAAAGIDGLICVDCPPEEADELTDALEEVGISLIRLTAPTTDDHRLATVVKRTSGFVYYVSVAGVTGVKSAQADDIAPAVARVRAASHLPVAVGFGIRTPEQAASVARIADGVVVGSAFVDEIAGALELIASGANENVTTRVLSKASTLAKAVGSARVGLA